MRFDYKILRDNYKAKFWMLLDIVSMTERERRRFAPFFKIRIEAVEFNPDFETSTRYWEGAVIMVRKTGERYIQVDHRLLENAPRLKRCILHELRHIEQIAKGLFPETKGTGYSLSKDNLKEYQSLDSEVDAIAHESLARWFK